jgi:Putative amidoligase enzyme
MTQNLLTMRASGMHLENLRSRIQKRWQGFDRPDRLHYLNHTPSERIARALRYKQKGREMAKYISSGDEYAAVDILNERSWPNKSEWPERLEQIFGGAFFCCNDCEHIGHLSDSHNAYDDYRICDSCRDDDYSWSEIRGCYISNSDWEDEQQEEARGSGLIGEYHSSKRLLGHIASAYDARKPRVLLGLELEMEAPNNREDAARMLLDNLADYKHERYMLLEEDRSISHGFEMVTAYTGLDVHAQQLAYFKQRLSGLKSHNTDTCGLHVHVCKSGMSMLHAAKLILFINDKNNLPLIKAIARRDAASYAKLQDKQQDKSWLKDALRGASSKERQLRMINSDRYEALNFQNPHTVEFRLFRGSLKYQTIMACLEFSFISWFFARDTSQLQLNTANFLQYICLENNRRDTVHLREYLASKGFALPFIKQLPAAQFLIQGAK